MSKKLNNLEKIISNASQYIYIYIYKLGLFANSPVYGGELV